LFSLWILLTLRLYDFLEHFERFLEAINKEKTILSQLKIGFVMVNLLFENFTRFFSVYFGCVARSLNLLVVDDIIVVFISLC
jgi:hypothetical protein